MTAPVTSLIERVFSERDLLSNISTLLLEEGGGRDRDPPPFLHTHKGPWLLSQICRSWRKDTLSYPELWSSIRIGRSEEDKRPTHAKFSQYAYLLSLQLLRSQKSPLSICMGPEWGFKTRQLDNILAMLIPHVERWKTLILSDEENFYPALLRAAADHLPLKSLNLERLEMTVDSLREDTDPESGRDTQLFDPEESWYSIRSASFTHSVPHFYNHLLAWEMLSELELVNINFIEIFLLEFHEELTGLETLKTRDCIWFSTPPIPAPYRQPLATYRIPRLRVLQSLNSIYEGDEDCPGPLPIFSWITTCFLEEIVMDYLTSEGISSLVSLVRTRGWTIRSFRCILGTTVQSFVPLLQAMKGLEDLSLEFVFDRHNQHLYPGLEFFVLAQALIRIEDHEFKHCPQLRQLSIRLIDRADEEQVLFALRILKKRAPKEVSIMTHRCIPSKLVAVRLLYKSDSKKEWEKLRDAKEVLALRDAGMAVTFHKL